MSTKAGLRQAQRDLEAVRAVSLGFSRDLRLQHEVSPQDLARFLVLLSAVDSRRDGLLMVAQDAIEQCVEATELLAEEQEDIRLPWWQRRGFVPGVLVGIGVSAALLALWLVA